MIRLIPRALTLPVEVPEVLPERLNSSSLREIERVSVYCGNQKLPLAEFFSIEKQGDQDILIFDGDCSRVKHIGEKMSTGTIRVAGSAGWQAGAEMSGGNLLIEGNAADMLGIEMRGGRIEVKGNAGNCVGGAYRGSRRGMLGGEILIDGDCGSETGHTMRRGLIAIRGDSGEFTGCNMLAGTIWIGGNVKPRCGVGLKRGTILVRSGAEIPPGFHSSGQATLTICRVLRRYLESLGMTMPTPFHRDVYERYCGDMLEGNRGEILVCR